MGPRGLSRGTAPAPPPGPTAQQVGFPPALSPVAGSSTSTQAVLGPVGARLSHPPVCSHLQRGGGRQHLGPFLPARERASSLCTGPTEEGGGGWINGDRGQGRRTGGTHRASTRPRVWSNTEMLPLQAGGPRPRQQPGNLKAWASHLRGAHQPGRRISRDPDGGPSRLLERQGQGSGSKVSRPCICSLGGTQPPTCQPQGHFNSHLATYSGDMSRHFGNTFGIELEESCDSKESRRRRTFRGLESRTQSLWDPIFVGPCAQGRVPISVISPVALPGWGLKGCSEVCKSEQE